MEGVEEVLVTPVSSKKVTSANTVFALTNSMVGSVCLVIPIVSSSRSRLIVSQDVSGWLSVYARTHALSLTIPRTLSYLTHILDDDACVCQSFTSSGLISSILVMLVIGLISMKTS